MNFKMDLEDFKKEFLHVYEWIDEPGTVYPLHSHKGKVAMYVTKGEITFSFPETDEEKKIVAGERFDVPVGKIHSAKVGLDGASYIIGEEVKGDS